jgi:hypothetical protein
MGRGDRGAVARTARENIRHTPSHPLLEMAMAGLECWHSRSLFSKLAAAAVISILPLRLSTIVPGVFTGDTNHFQKVNTGGS